MEQKIYVVTEYNDVRGTQDIIGLFFKKKKADEFSLDKIKYWSQYYNLKFDRKEYVTETDYTLEDDTVMIIIEPMIVE